MPPDPGHGDIFWTKRSSAHHPGAPPRTKVAEAFPDGPTGAPPRPRTFTLKLFKLFTEGMNAGQPWMLGGNGVRGQALLLPPLFAVAL
jgi:hypothetical protein